MSTQAQFQKLDSSSACRGHLSDAEFQYLEDFMEYIPFIVVARTWGEKVNNIIKQKWTKVKVSHSMLSPTDTLARYLPCPPLVQNVGENLGVDTEEEIAGILQHMLLKEMFRLIQQLPDKPEDEKKDEDVVEDKEKDELKAEDAEEEDINIKEEFIKILTGGFPQEANLKLVSPGITPGEDPTVIEITKPFASSVKLDD